MYLKSIEIQGFKSFANKTLFDFHSGITAVVGPNGSGKSNVADAVRWVLGEQKVRQIRSSNMQDVIFAGTQNRRPVSFAHVAITMDNSDHALALDYEEVTVARRVYRSGESEYLLNGRVCRLKDIHELFYDTGIGKEGYSIIGQGQIDQVLSGKPEDRRELFDEAAGIVKFKRRKALTAKKLENEKQNMLRVTDILTELERQVEPLERQSEKARAYLKKKEELKSLEVNLFLLDMERIEGEGRQLREKHEVAVSRQDETSAEHEKLRLKYEEEDARIQENDGEITRLQSLIAEQDVDREKTEGQINVLKEQIRNIEQGETHMRERLDELDREIARCEKTGNSYSDEKEALDKKIHEAGAEKEKLDESLAALRAEAEACEKKAEEGKGELLSLLDARATIEGEQQRFAAMEEQADIRKAQLSRQLLQHRSTGRDLLAQLSSQTEELERLDEEIRSAEEEKAGAEKKRRSCQNRVSELEREIDSLRQKFHRSSSRLESLKNIAERYDGYGSAIRRVMGKRREVEGIRGVVADLIKVEKKYETAIETALGGSIQNIVTDNEETAKKMIAYLKENRCGRATFLPLTSVRMPGEAREKKALGAEGVIGMADTLVTVGEEYRRVAANLLGRVLVVDTADHATAIAKEYRYSLRIVTLEGESLHPGGSITGGAFKKSGNLLGRAREIRELEKEIRQLRGEMEKTEARLGDLQKTDALAKEELRGIRATLQDHYIKQSSLRAEVEHMRGERAHQETFSEDIQKEMRGIEEEKSGIESEKQKILLKLEESGKREGEIETSNEKLEREAERIRTGLERVQKKAADAAVAVAQLQQKSDFSRENIQRVAEQIRALQSAKEDIIRQSSDSGREIESRRRQIKEAEDACAEASQKREELSARLARREEEKETMARELKGFLGEREALSEELAGLDKEVFRLADRMEKLEAEKESRIDYMWQEYEIAPHEAGSPGAEDMQSASQLKKEISAARSEIRDLGNVNVNAIEEYKALSQRHTFLRGQYEDLQDAEKALRDVISDLDRGMRTQFEEKFADIQREFDAVFRNLFGGGKGTLELAREEEKDLLECGVNIIAQPPGKKLQNMMQLSGGEKALTAIALLFAIQNLKPSPFCLLDEIEAALDDLNVERYAKYLHELAQNTQFIIITHRRGTMSAADRLYGITMQEKGVSVPVSVNLTDSEAEG